MPDIAWVGKGTYTSGIGALSVPPPSGIAAGDLLVLITCVVGTVTITTPSGWTPISDTTTTGRSSRVFWKIAGESEGNVTVADFGDSQRAIMIAYRGGDTIIPVPAYTNNGDTGTTFSAANPTASLNGCMLVNCVGFYDADANDTTNYSSWANASLVSITEGHDQSDDTGAGGGITFAYGIKTSAGAIDATTATTDSSSNYSANTNFLISPIQPKKSNFFMFM